MKTFKVPCTDGVEVSVHNFHGTGEALLFLHGTGLPSLTYTPVIQKFRRFFSCFALDFRGHGHSADSTNGYTWEGFIDDVATAVKTIDKPLSIFSHSLGGAIALKMSLELREQIRAVYCYEPIVFTDEIADDELTRYQFQLSKKIQTKNKSFLSRDDVRKRYSARGAFSKLDPNCLEHYITHAFRADIDGFHLRTTPLNESLMYQLGRCPDLFEGLHQITAKVRLAYGLLEPAGPAKYVPKIQSLIPNSSLKVFSQLAHLGPLEDPLIVAGDALEFFLHQ